MASLLSPFSDGSHLFKRCVQCPDDPPTCPVCKSDEVCRQTAASCESCASASCVKEALSGITSTGSSSTSKGPNVGGIAGGVIGGVVGIAIIAFVIWKFVLKGRRHEVEPEQEYFDEEEEDDIAPEKLRAPGSILRMREAGAGSSRASTHTVGSLASTVLTRASNIIQIAYIPGITNRSTLQSPGLLVPPVPPIPIPTTPSTLNSAYGPNGEEQRFFVPELRDSLAYTDTSSIAARTDADGASRKSVASSLARSTIYRDSAVVNPMPATTIVRGRPAIVSVKSSNSSNATPTDSPAIGPTASSIHSPITDLSRAKSNASSAASARPITASSVGSARPIMIKMPSSSDSVRPSQFGSQKSGKSIASTLAGARSVKPIALNILKKNKTPASTTSEDSKTEEDGKSIDTPKAMGLGLHRLSEVPSTHSPDTPITSASPHARALRDSRADDTEQTEDEGDDHERGRQSLFDRREELKSPFEDENEAQTPTPTRTEFAKDRLP